MRILFSNKKILYIYFKSQPVCFVFSFKKCGFFLKFKLLWRNSSANFSAYDLQHNQLAGTKFVSQGNDGSFVMAHRDVEDVHSGGECADLTSVLHSPQADGSVFTTGYDDFVVRGNGNAPNLKERRSFTIHAFI